MKKPKRPKVSRDWLENQLAKCERRIQKIAENAYQIRTLIERFDAYEAQKTLKKENTDALYNNQREGEASERGTDSNTGESQLSDNGVIDSVLEEQSTGVSSDQ